MRSFDRRLNKRLGKQSWGWWFETLSRQYDVIVMASTAMVLTYFAQNIPVSAPEVLNRVFHFQCVRECNGLFHRRSQPSLAKPPLEFCSQWVIKFDSLSRTSDIEVHVINTSRAITTFTLESLSSVTQKTYNLQVNLKEIKLKKKG